MKVYLEIPRAVHESLLSHLFQARTTEETGFLFVKPSRRWLRLVFRYKEWYAVPSDGYVSQSEFHLELADNTRATVIKRAHDLGSSLVEFHSHAGPGPARFSPSDYAGLAEFVPHVWWRLKGRPYIAVVVADSSFDGLVWLKEPHKAQRLKGIVVGKRVLKPTRLSSLSVQSYGNE